MNIKAKEKMRSSVYSFFREKSWLLIFAFCIVYWAYLIIHTRMLVVFDSIEYEATGKLIYQNGWIDFFRSGPQREPLYPALVALSMALADFLSANYQFVLKIFQVILLFLTQVFMVILLRKLNIRESIIKGAAIYFAVSPAIINSALSLYCEIVVFPLVLAAVLLVGSIWSDICQNKKYLPMLGKSALFGACFSLLALGRNIFQYVFYLFIVSFIIYVLYAILIRKVRILLQLFASMFVAVAIFYSVISYVKTMNFVYNGERVICNRHFSILLGSAYKRSQPISLRIVSSHIASIPGNGICRMFFSKEECEYADWYGSEQFRRTEVVQAMDAMPKDQQDREAFLFLLGKVMDRPGQYLFFSAVEALKMPFWESTQIGFVEYPRFLVKLYESPFMRLGLRLLAGFLTIVALGFVTFWMFFVKLKHRHVLFFIWFLIIAYMFFYSSCYVIIRYSLPIASLYIVCISFMINAFTERLANPVKI